MQLLCVIKQLGYHARRDWSKTCIILCIAPYRIKFILLNLSYKNNGPHFLLVHGRDNPLGMLGEHERNL